MSTDAGQFMGDVLDRDGKPLPPAGVTRPDGTVAPTTPPAAPRG